MSYISPNDAQWAWLNNTADPGSPLTMLNLLRFAEQADYSGGPNEPACSGKEAYRRYSELALPCVTDHGGSVAASGNVGPTVIGPESEKWDLMLLVRYPTISAFLEMVTSERYRSIVHHRTAALQDSRLVPILGAADIG